MLTAGVGCCIVYDDYPGNLDNQRAANARLIAAAPELLEACRKATRALCSDPPEGPQKSITASDDTIYHLDGAAVGNALNALRAAVARATGSAEPAVAPTGVEQMPSREVF